MTVHVAVVVGAATPPGRLHAASMALAEDVAALGCQPAVVDLSAVTLAAADGRPDDGYDEATRTTVATITGADAAVVASPVYRASVPGVLKNLLDLVPVAGLHGKPVGILTMGGSDHHYLGADRHLRDVLAWFGALVAPTSVYLTGADFTEGRPTDAARATIRQLAATVLALADRLRGVDLGPDPLAKRAW